MDVESSVSVTTDDKRVTADDVLELNRSVLVQTARFCRVLGTVLMTIGALGVLLWLWVVLRQQEVIGESDGPFSFGFDGAEVSAKQRLDVFATTFSVLTSAVLPAGLGLVLRVLGQHMISEKGGSLTRVRIGDLLPRAADEQPWLAEDDDDPAP